MFTPNNEFLFDFEFEYPARWGLLEEDRSTNEKPPFSSSIRKRDPSKAVPDCEIEFGCDSRPTIILIALAIDPTPQWTEDFIARTHNLILNIDHIELISDQVILIDGYKAYVIMTYDSNLQTTTTSITFQVNDRGYVLVINLLSEEDLDGDFYQAFWEIIESIKFIDIPID